jgi:hypothetical protein
LGKRKKENNEDKLDSALNVKLVGGPKDGEVLRMANPLPFRVRFAWPEWCVYEYVNNTELCFVENETGPIPRDGLTVKYMKGVSS